MPIYRIADLNIEIKPKCKETAARLEPWRTNDDAAVDMSLSAGDGEIKKYAEESGVPCPPWAAEDVLLLTELCRTVLDKYNGFFFHSSTLMMNGEGYVFSAPSGTGKSTHTALWRKRFGSAVTMINDDKPIIRRVNGVFYVYGTPWMGKADIGSNTKAPVKAVYLITRANENKAVRLSPARSLAKLLEASALDFERERMMKLLDLWDEMFSIVPLFELRCNMTEQAAQTAYEAAQVN